MSKLSRDIKELEIISSTLEPSEKYRNEYIQHISEYANSFLNNLDYQKTFVFSTEKSEKLKIRDTTKSIDQILDIYNDEVVNKGLKAASGGHIGYIPGGGIFTSSISDFLTDVTNEYAGMFYASPGAVTIENELINWMKNIFGYPKEAVGNLTSGGSIANLIALTSARDKYKIKGALIEKSVIYLSAQVHHCILKSLRIIGLEDIIIRHIDLDNFSRIKIDSLQKNIDTDINSGLNPFMVIASAGTTDTGAIDPLDKIGLIAKKYKLWYHIDAAYGGFFILSQSKKHLFEGIELSDSLVVDPHKGLFLPYGLGAVLIKDKNAVFHSHRYTANYMQDAVNNNLAVNPADVSPELTKPFRGLRLWIPLQLHGIKPFTACLDEKLLLTKYMRIELNKLGFNLGPEPDLSVSYFWYSYKNIPDNDFNKKLLEFIHADGSVYFSSTVFNDKFVIRIAILSFRTKLKTINKGVALVKNSLDKTIDFFRNT